MRVCVALEQRFLRLPDGTVWTQSGFRTSFWLRYLSVFDRVRCLARVRDVTRLEADCHRVDGGPVSVTAVPHYIGPAQLLGRLLEVRRVVRAAVCPGDAFVLRVPGTIGDLASHRLGALAYPFGVEVIGDPRDVFAPGAVRHPLRRFLRWHATRQLTRQCRLACGASYVTERVLQQRYPTTATAIGASSIELHDEAFTEGPRTFAPAAASALLFVGSLEQYYKAPDVLIRALARAVADGADLRLTVVGEGRCQPALAALAVQLGCAHRVAFRGHLAAVDVRAAIDAADVFVLPSRTEGLPRAMVEAMARGVPCIGSTAGGIPELLPADALVPPGDVGALAARIRDVVTDPSRMNRMAAVNYARAKDYRHEVLQQRRVRFYRAVREATEVRLGQSAPFGAAAAGPIAGASS